MQHTTYSPASKCAPDPLNQQFPTSQALHIDGHADRDATSPTPPGPATNWAITTRTGDVSSHFPDIRLSTTLVKPVLILSQDLSDEERQCHRDIERDTVKRASLRHESLVRRTVYMLSLVRGSRIIELPHYSPPPNNRRPTHTSQQR